VVCTDVYLLKRAPFSPVYIHIRRREFELLPKVVEQFHVGAWIACNSLDAHCERHRIKPNHSIREANRSTTKRRVVLQEGPSEDGVCTESDSGLRLKGKLLLRERGRLSETGGNSRIPETKGSQELEWYWPERTYCETSGCQVLDQVFKEPRSEKEVNYGERLPTRSMFRNLNVPVTYKDDSLVLKSSWKIEEKSDSFGESWRPLGYLST